MLLHDMPERTVLLMLVKLLTGEQEDICQHQDESVFNSLDQASLRAHYECILLHPALLAPLT